MKRPASAQTDADLVAQARALVDRVDGGHGPASAALNRTQRAPVVRGFWRDFDALIAKSPRTTEGVRAVLEVVRAVLLVDDKSRLAATVDMLLESPALTAKLEATTPASEVEAPPSAQLVSADAMASPRLTYGIDELADMLGVHRATIQRRINAGTLKTTKTFGRTLVLAESVKNLLGAIDNN